MCPHVHGFLLISPQCIPFRLSEHGTPHSITEVGVQPIFRLIHTHTSNIKYHDSSSKPHKLSKVSWLVFIDLWFWGLYHLDNINGVQINHMYLLFQISNYHILSLVYGFPHSLSHFLWLKPSYPHISRWKVFKKCRLHRPRSVCAGRTSFSSPVGVHPGAFEETSQPKNCCKLVVEHPILWCLWLDMLGSISWLRMIKTFIGPYLTCLIQAMIRSWRKTNYNGDINGFDQQIYGDLIGIWWV